jgi:hypothetical protein
LSAARLSATLSWFPELIRGMPLPAIRRWWGFLAVLAGLYWIVRAFTTDSMVAVDGYGYFAATADSLYDHPVGAIGAFLYSPAVFQAMEPLRGLGYEPFLVFGRAFELVALVALAGPLLPLTLLAYVPIALELGGLNVHLLMAGGIALGFRWPAVWSFVLLTKITPGVGLIWFAVRREWRHLALALGATAIIAGVSFLLAPNLWFEWLGRLTAPQLAVDARWTVPSPPLAVRLPLALALIAWGARRNLRWTIYAGTFLALPVVWISGLVMLIPALRAIIEARPRGLARTWEPRPLANPESAG